MNSHPIEILVCTATPDDLTAMLKIEQSAFPKNRWASRHTLELRMELFPPGNSVAVANGEVVGFCNGFPIGNLTTQKQLDPGDSELFLKYGNNWLLRNVAVSPEFQGMGVGSQLVNNQLEVAKNFNSEFIRFTATPNLDNFYLQLGFNKIREAEDFHGVPQALWEKKLTA